MGTLDGRGLMVTGASWPMGRVLAESAQARGARVIACEHRPGEAMDEHIRQARTSSPACFSPVRADLADEAVVDSLFDMAADTGSLGTLLNVVSPGAGASLLGDLRDRDWHDMVTSSLRTSFLVIQRAVGDFICGGGGRIVNVIDLTAPCGAGGVATTLATALLSLSRCVAKEYGRRGVACNAVVAHTESTGVGGSLEDAAGLVLYLASRDASMVTGDELAVAIRPGGRQYR
jgi:3-oxoacyl-[acyl-carrier protein] reductase